MSKPIRWIFNAKALPPGDLLVLSATLRELHFWYEGQFETDVVSDFPAIWENNPYVTPLDEERDNVIVIDLVYPQAALSNYTPAHFIGSFVDHLNREFNLRLSISDFRGEVYLSDRDLQSTPQVAELCGVETPYWIIVSGGKYDSTVKWWDQDRYQEVVDHFRGKVLFVQVGQPGFHHPRLSGVLDLRGRTDLRGLMRLVYHSQGVFSPVTFPMHLNAAVPLKGEQPRGGVVVAGGREPPNWYAYPTQQVLHTVGSLPCCADGGCWRSRVHGLFDGDENDEENLLCLNVVDDHLPKCMDMISAERAITAIESYYEGGVLLEDSEPFWTKILPKLSESSLSSLQALQSDICDF